MKDKNTNPLQMFLELSTVKQDAHTTKNDHRTQTRKNNKPIRTPGAKERDINYVRMKIEMDSGKIPLEIFSKFQSV